MFIPQSVLRDDNPDSTGGAGGFNPFAPTSAAPSEPTPTPTPTPTPEPTPTPAPVVQPVETAPVPGQPAAQPGAQPAATPTTQPTTQPTPASVVLSPEQFQQLIAARGGQTDAGRQGQPAMSVEEFQKTFNIFNATDATYEAILGVKPTSPAQVAALNDALQGVSRQSVTIMRHLMAAEAGKIRQEFRPAAETVQTQREEAVFKEFVTEYPGLNGYGPMLKEIVTAAKARGQNFTSIKEASTFVAAQAARLLNRDVNSFRTAVAQGNPQTQPSGQPAGNPRQMSTTSLGGRTGSAGGAAPAKSTAERLFQEATT